MSDALSQLTPKVLIALGAPAARAELMCEPIKAACALFGIHSAEALGAFLGQCAVETVRYTKLEESLYYSTQSLLVRNFRAVRALPVDEQAKYLRAPEKLANLVYANRIGNGDVASGDGWKYRGRGCIQTTGRANYESAAALTGRPYVDQPDLLKEPSEAALSAAAFFVHNGCVQLAEAGGSLTAQVCNAITHKVNPAMLEADLRAHLGVTAYGLLRY